MNTLSIVIPALDEAKNLNVLIPLVKKTIFGMNLAGFEIIVVTRLDDIKTQEVVKQHEVRLIIQTNIGYGGALLSGFKSAHGDYIITMDADFSHPPKFINELWDKRLESDIVIASRYIWGGTAKMSSWRYGLSRILNLVFSRGLSLHVKDMSSGFRLYKKSAIENLSLVSRDFNILQEILVRSYAQGQVINEIPFDYMPRRDGKSHARVLPFGIAYVKTFWSLWKYRNSIESADYDFRAYDSLIPLQRYWQRMRYKHITELLMPQIPVLDVGCGSSRIISALPKGSVALDILLRKVRFSRRLSQTVSFIHSSGFDLPFPDSSFSCVLCSEVIEHVPKDSSILSELHRVLKPGGHLVIGTPDYANWQWVYMEKLYKLFAPGAYADEHISHYTYAELKEIYEKQGYIFVESRYILQGELIMSFKKAGGLLT